MRSVFLSLLPPFLIPIPTRYKLLVRCNLPCFIKSTKAAEVIVKRTLVKKTPALQATWNRKYLEELRVITKKFLIKYLFSLLC